MPRAEFTGVNQGLTSQLGADSGGIDARLAALGLTLATEMPGKSSPRMKSGLPASLRGGFIYTDTLIVPENALRARTSRLELHPTIIDFETRANQRPPEYDTYVKRTDGQARFDFDTPKHTETIQYIGGLYAKLKFDSTGRLKEFVEPYGSDSVDELRDKMMTGVTITEGGTLVVPYDHHMPNRGEGHYNGDFFYWDTLWSAKWASSRGDVEFLKGVMNNFEYEYRADGYIPTSNRGKVGDRSQPPMLPLIFAETTKVLPDTEEANKWRARKVELLKSEYFNVWVDDPVGEGLYDAYTGLKKDGKSSLWKNQAQTPTGLSRYGCADIIANRYSGEAATGEDIGPRFRGEPEKYNPTDLAALRGIAQSVFREEALRVGNIEEATYWGIKFEETKDLVNADGFMWNEARGWYMDYNFVDNKQSDVMASAAALLVLAGLVPDDRRDRMAKNLHKFAAPYGSFVTTGEEPATPGREGMESWGHPNRWAAREDLLYSAFMPYKEYHPILEELMIRSQIGSAEYRARHQTLPEVLDGNTGGLGGSALYPRSVEHEGFLWTAVTYLENDRRLAEIYALRDRKEETNSDSDVHELYVTRSR